MTYDDWKTESPEDERYRLYGGVDYDGEDAPDGPDFEGDPTGNDGEGGEDE